MDVSIRDPAVVGGHFEELVQLDVDDAIADEYVHRVEVNATRWASPQLSRGHIEKNRFRVVAYAMELPHLFAHASWCCSHTLGSMPNHLVRVWDDVVEVTSAVRNRQVTVLLAGQQPRVVQVCTLDARTKTCRASKQQHVLQAAFVIEGDFQTRPQHQHI